MSLAKDFREFVLRGNVIDLAVGVIIGGAFSGIVGALVKDIITPFVGMFGKVDLSGYNMTIHGAKFGFGDFLNSVVSFLILAFVIFFFIAKPVNLRCLYGKPTPRPIRSRVSARFAPAAFLLVPPVVRSARLS